MAAAQILDASGDPVLPAEIERIRAQAMMDGFGRTDYEAPYHASSLLSQDTAAWRPALRSGDFAGLIRRDLTIARIHDIVSNDPHASTALDKLVDLLVGPGLRLSAKPDGVALGIKDREKLRNFARQMQSEWRLFADDPRKLCDKQRKLTMNGLLRLMARTWLTLGEAAAVLTLNDAPGARYETCVLTVDPDRICNPYSDRDTLTLRAGVEMDADGAPIAYHVRDAHLGDYWAPFQQVRWTRVERSTSWGRPVFVHGYEPLRDGDTRGTSPFITLITLMRMLGKFRDNELATATLNALFSAFVESNLGIDEVAQRLSPVTDARTQMGYAAWLMEYFEKYPARVGGVRIPVMPPGSKVTLNSTPRPATSFAAIETAFLQTFGARLNIPYEELKGDWSKTNYSSFKGALNGCLRGMRRMMATFTEQIVAPIQLAWADEAFDKGYLRPPSGADFWEMPGAYLRSKWIGPGRGYVDELKEIEAAGLRMEGLVSTLEIECALQGHDYEDILDQIALEVQDLKDRKLTRLSLVAAVQSARGPKPDSQDAEGPAGPDGDATGKGASQSGGGGSES
jgi:lambda family phage portal protein